MPRNVNSANGFGKNSRTVGEQKPGSSGGHSLARTTLVLTPTPLSLPEPDRHVVDRCGRPDDHPDRLDEGRTQPEVDQPADPTPHADAREQGPEGRPALSGSRRIRR